MALAQKRANPIHVCGRYGDRRALEGAANAMRERVWSQPPRYVVVGEGSTVQPAGMGHG